MIMFTDIQGLLYTYIYGISMVVLIVGINQESYNFQIFALLTTALKQAFATLMHFYCHNVVTLLNTAKILKFRATHSNFLKIYINLPIFHLPVSQPTVKTWLHYISVWLQNFYTTKVIMLDL